MRPRRIFLVGPSGAGKSTLARRWARSLKVPYLDTDSEIERRSQKTIAELFAAGEAVFREWEKNLIPILLQECPMGIWALGGGTLIQPELRETLPKEGFLLWIDPPISWLLARLRQKSASRPLLHQRPEEEWEHFLQSRRVFYRIADLHWDPTRVPERLVRAWVARLFSLSADIRSANSQGWQEEGDSTPAPSSVPLPAPKSHSAALLHLPSRN